VRSQARRQPGLDRMSWQRLGPHARLEKLDRLALQVAQARDALLSPVLSRLPALLLEQFDQFGFSVEAARIDGTPE
jgi:hypothetical protein